MSKRVKQLRSNFHQRKIDAYLVTNDVNIRYLTGFPACESWLLVGARQAFYITDFRYLQEAREGLKGIRIKCFKDSLYETLSEAIKEMHVKRIGIDTRHVTLSQYRRLEQSSLRGIKWIKADNLIEDLRAIKDNHEIKCIKKTLNIHAKSLGFIKRNIKNNINERELLLSVERYVKEQGAGLAFDPIIASGPNSCYPHAKVTKRKIRRGEPLLIDMGI